MNYLSDSSLHGVNRRFGLLLTNTKNKNINSEYYLPTLEQDLYREMKKKYVTIDRINFFDQNLKIV